MSNGGGRWDVFITKISEGSSGDCTPGNTQSCNTGLLGICAAGTKTCDDNGGWGECVQGTQSSQEICDEGVDNDCDSKIDGSDEDCGGSIDGDVNGDSAITPADALLTFQQYWGWQS